MTAYTQDPGAALVILHQLLDPASEPEYNRWYEEEHIPERLVLPGVTDVARYQNCVDASRHLIYYKLDALTALTPETFQFRLPHDGTPWTKRMRTLFHMPYRNVYRGNAWSRADAPKHMLSVFADAPCPPHPKAEASDGFATDWRLLTSACRGPRHLSLVPTASREQPKEVVLGTDVSDTTAAPDTHLYELVGAYDAASGTEDRA